MSDTGIPGYKIIKKIAKGGMARVFIAIQETVGRTIAIKILPKDLCKDNSFSSLFLREANCGVLNHPNIITIYEAGETDSHLYIAMEYLNGGDLKQKIKSGLSQTETIKIITKLSEALAYAHSKGYIHRDIKPGNIIFNEEKQPILADFGIAKAISFSEQTITDGTLMGTPHYTSPEQVSGVKVDHRADLYSLGVVYYEMITGSRPFVADTPYTLIFKHLEEAPPKLASEFKDHQPIIHKLMAKDPDDRYASAFDLIEDLAKLTRAKKEQAAIRSDRMRVYKNSAVLVTLVLAFTVILSDNLSDYTGKQLTELKAFAARASRLSHVFAGDIEKQRKLVTEREKEIKSLKEQIDKFNVVAVHLSNAANYMENRRYISPKKTSALAEYTLVLSIDPENIQAHAGISVITRHFYNLAKNEKSKGSFFNALDYIDSGLIASPHDKSLIHMRDKIIKRMDISIKRMKLENELLLVKRLIKNENYEQAIEKLEFLQTISKRNERILSLLSIAQNQLQQELSAAE